MEGKIPLRAMLKGKLLRIAELQDRLMIEMSPRFDVVLHGGTAVWRVYGGRRVSLDIDLYCPDPGKIIRHFEASGEFPLARSTLTPSHVACLSFEEGDTLAEVQLSPPFRHVEEADGEFTLVDGESIIVKTLSPENLLSEKIRAFKGRGKARDLYDIFFLLDKADTAKARRELKSLMPLSPPKDYPGLGELILLGRVPEFGTVARKVKKHAKGEV